MKGEILEMLDYDNVTSGQGARIIFIFEDDEFKNELSKNAPSQKAFQDTTRKRISQTMVDTNKGIVYVLINSQGITKAISESEYLQWQNAAKKEWFHQYVYAF
ncbi:MAG: hypothetical protein WCT51_02970 [Candidatus Shapirobacteria bacterium]|jgi:hypothetical protein